VGIRETLNKNPALTTGGMIAIIVLALGVVVFEMKPKSAGPPKTGYFYTDDDGQSWFIDSMTNYPPFDHGGKQAVQAHVFLKNGQPTCVYESKLTDDMKALLADPSSGDVSADKGTMVKRPGEPDDKWVLQSDPEGAAVIKDAVGLQVVMPGSQ
jgi:hypothetical protein